MHVIVYVIILIVITIVLNIRRRCYHLPFYKFTKIIPPPQYWGSGNFFYLPCCYM